MIPKPCLHSVVRYFRPNVFTLAGAHASWKKTPPSSPPQKCMLIHHV